MVDYEIKYSKRKTVAIYITLDGKVEVRCPKRTRKSDIEEFITQKQKWIEKKLSELSNKNKVILKAGETSLYLGDEHPIINTDDEEGFYSGAFHILKSEGDQYVYDALKQIYIQKAKELIPQRVHKYEGIMGLCALKIGITSAKTRWGSCSAKNSLNFTWKLIMADLDTIDYVVVHELAHIKEKNHSKNFWNLVGIYKPDYKDSKKKLRDLAVRIRRDSWEK
jgi:hypothetical protein